MTKAISTMLSGAGAALRGLAAGIITLTIRQAAARQPGASAGKDIPAGRLATIRIEVILGR
jgi:hypothetical protein